MAFNWEDYELTPSQMKANEKMLAEYDSGLGHDETDYINNNNW